MKYSFLLVDLNSVFHGPPKDIGLIEKRLTTLYSSRFNSEINDRLSINSDSNWNAINTKFVTNFGLLMLSTVVKERGHFTEYVNGDYYNDKEIFYNRILKNIHEHNVVCITSTTPQFEDAKEIACMLRNKGFNGVLVLGGPHAYYFKSRYEDTCFDLICIGHDIVSSVNRIEDMLNKGVDRIPWESRKTIIHIAEGYQDLPKDFSLIPQKYLSETLLYTYTTYGCPNSCKYCVEHYFNSNIHFRNTEMVFSEIEFMIENAGTKSIHLADSDFFINHFYAEKFINEVIERGINACYTVNTSPKTICNNRTVELVKFFYDKGLIELLIGVEYFSENILLQMNKNYDIREFYINLIEIRKHCPKLIISFYSLIGLPGSNTNSMIENIKWMEKFYKDNLFDFSFPKFFVPYPGTDIFEEPEVFDVKIVHNNWETYHRWALPRPLLQNGITDRDLLKEIESIYRIYE